MTLTFCSTNFIVNRNTFEHNNDVPMRPDQVVLLFRLIDAKRPIRRYDEIVANYLLFTCRTVEVSIETHCNIVYSFYRPFSIVYNML